MKRSDKAKIEAELAYLKEVRKECEPGNEWLVKIDRRIAWLEKKVRNLDGPS